MTVSRFRSYLRQSAVAIVLGCFGLIGVIAQLFLSAHQAEWNEAELRDQLQLARFEIEKTNQNLNQLATRLSEIDDLNNQMTSDFFDKVGLTPLSNASPDAFTSLVGPEAILPDEEAVLAAANDPRTAALGQSTDSVGELAQTVYQRMLTRKEYSSSIPSEAPTFGWISSQFGERRSPFTKKLTPHNGIDIAAPEGTPVFAPADGIVGFAGYYGAYGQYILINHGFGIVTRYGHTKQLFVYPGQLVSKGQKIALVGSTGRSTGSHLHYEVLVNNKQVDPRPFMLDAGEKILGDLWSPQESFAPTATEWQPDFPMGGEEDALAGEGNELDLAKSGSGEAGEEARFEKKPKLLAAVATSGIADTIHTEESIKPIYTNRIKTAAALTLPWLTVGVSLVLIGWALVRGVAMLGLRRRGLTSSLYRGRVAGIETE